MEEKRNSNGKSTVGAWVTPQERAWLEKEAERTDRTVSYLMRKAIKLLIASREYLEV